MSTMGQLATALSVIVDAKVKQGKEMSDTPRTDAAKMRYEAFAFEQRRDRYEDGVQAAGGVEWTDPFYIAGRLERELAIKSAFLSSRQCPDHSGKWERGRCLQCDLAAAQAKAPEGWIDEELKDGDMICDAAGVQRTEGGRLPVPKLLHAIKDAKRYAARRRTIYETRMRLQVGGPRALFMEFVREYDAACDREIIAAAPLPDSQEEL